VDEGGISLVASESQDALTRAALKLTLSSGTYADALKRVGEGSSSRLLASVLQTQASLDRGVLGGIGPIMRRIAQIDTTTPAMRSLASVNINLSAIAAGVAVAKPALMKAFGDQAHIHDVYKGIGHSPATTSAFARMDMSRALSVSLAAQANLANMQGLSIGRLAGFDSLLSRTTTARLASFTRSYDSLIDAVATTASLAPHLPLITSSPPVEYYRQVELLKSVTTSEEQASDVDVVDAELTASLPKADVLLVAFDPSLQPLLAGAHESLRDDNPDRVRHVTVSLRELLNHVLHRLAPDEQVQEWARDRGLVDVGRPTRRARLLYICRSMECDALGKFLEQDAQSTLALMNALNSGTHVVTSQLTCGQLRALVLRMESLLVFLLQIAHEE
jgi:hypothetical protein